MKEIEQTLMLLGIGTVMQKMVSFPTSATKEVLEECDAEFWNSLSHGQIVKELTYLTQKFLIKYQKEIDKILEQNKEVFEHLENGDLLRNIVNMDNNKKQ